MFCVNFVLWFLRGLGARPTVIRVIFLCAKTAIDIAIKQTSKARIQYQ